MSNPQFVMDGDFTVAQQNGIWRKERPFSKWGYFQPFIARRKMRQLESSFTPPTPMTTRTFANEVSVTYPTAQVSAGQVLVTGSTTRSTPAIAYLTGITEAVPVDDSSGLVEWEEEWCNIPEKMLVWGSATYTQVFGLDIDDNPQQVNTSFDSYTIYEFAAQPDFGLDVFAFVTTAGTAFPLPVPTLPTLIAPKIVELAPGVPKILGGAGVTTSQITAQSVPILAEDSNNTIYQGRIIQRESKWVVKKLFTSV